MRGVIATEGIGGIYRGFVMAGHVRALNGLAIMFMNQIKPFVPKSIGTDGTAASIGGYALAAVVTNPADVVKTRIQVQKSNPELFAYDGAIDCFLKIRARGARPFDGVPAASAGWRRAARSRSPRSSRSRATSRAEEARERECARVCVWGVWLVGVRHASRIPDTAGTTLDQSASNARSIPVHIILLVIS